MALALILKKSLSIQATQNFIKTTIKSNQIRPFSILLNKFKENPNAIKSHVSKRLMSGDHGKLWTLERAFSLGLLGVVPVALVASNTILDDVLAAAVVIHFHWGLEACVIDYVRPILFGPVVPKISLGLLYLISISTLAGLLYYNHHSLGISNTVKKVWKN